MNRVAWALLGLAVVGLVAAVALRRKTEPAVPPPAPVLPAWIVCSEGDFQYWEAVEEGGRIRLQASTRGTRDETVKFLGMRSRRPVWIGPGARCGARMDWNDQANGSYLSGALVLSPEATTSNPLRGQDWFKVEYVGVPPGKNARLLIACRTAGRERILFTEGWPAERREGRRIGLQDIEIEMLPGGGVRVRENSLTVFESEECLLNFAQAHLIVQLSTHSNYPLRTIFFDKLRYPG